MSSAQDVRGLSTHLLYRSVIMSTSISENNSCCFFASMLRQFACVHVVRSGNSL